MSKMEIFISNLGRLNNDGVIVGNWVRLPASEEELDNVLKRIGCSGDGVYHEYFISDYETAFHGMRDVISEYADLTRLNELARVLESLDEADEEKLCAALECEYCRSVEDVLDILERMDDLLFLPGITDYEELGDYYINGCGYLEVPQHLLPYFDYSAYARDVHLEGGNGTFCTTGYLIDYR